MVTTYQHLPTTATDIGAVASTTRTVYEKIRRMIVVGELAPGKKLKISSLCEKVDSGSSPVREALSLLTSEHLVDRIDQRGFRAAEVSLENFHEVLELRSTLDCQALEKSIASATQEWEESLVLCHHRMQQSSPENLEAFEERHKAFHMALLSGCDAPVLLRFCSQLYDLNVRYRYLAGNALNYRKRDTASEHLSIMHAAIDRDAAKAKDALVEHYGKTGQFLGGMMSAKQ